MNVVSLLAPYFEKYLTLERVHPTKTYDYRARGFIGWPVIDVTLHKPKCARDSWLYIAVRCGSNLASLAPEDKLYVGSQTMDRMFRGDGLNGSNFHHAQMRAGNGHDNPVTYLRSAQKVDIHRMPAATIRRTVAEVPELATLQLLLQQPKQHVGYWFEQFILHTERGQWRWNTAAATGAVQSILNSTPPQRAARNAT